MKHKICKEFVQFTNSYVFLNDYKLVFLIYWGNFNYF